MRLAVGEMVKGSIMNIVAGRMQEYDLAQIMKIQSDNLREHLTPSHQKDGYLSIAFTETEFRAFNLNLGVVVARTHHEVIGYSCLKARPPETPSTVNSAIFILRQNN